MQTYFSNLRVNPLNPHNAAKHHFTSVRNDSISFRKPGGFRRTFPWNCFNNITISFFSFVTLSKSSPSTTSRELRKFRVERVKQSVTIYLSSCTVHLKIIKFYFVCCNIALLHILLPSKSSSSDCFLFK